MKTRPNKLHAMLRVAFSHEEIAFLEGHPRFQRLLKESDGSDASAHALVKEGGALIQQHYGGPTHPRWRSQPGM